MRRFYARVEHKVVVGDDLFNFLAVTSYLDSAALWDEAAQTNLTRTLT